MERVTILDKPGTLHRFRTEDERFPDLWSIGILGAYYIDDEGEKCVFALIGNNKAKQYVVDGEVTRVKEGFYFKSDRDFFGIGPFHKTDYEEIFNGVPMTVEMMEELFPQNISYMIQTPESEDSPIEAVYIRKEDGSFYVKIGDGWLDGSGDEDSLSLIQVGSLNAGKIAKSLIIKQPLTASKLKISI